MISFNDIQKEAQMAVKVTFDFKAGQILVEGAEGDLIKIAQEAKSLAPLLSEIRIITEQVHAKVPESHDASLNSNLESNKRSMREFAKSLSLSNTYERIAALAYYAIKVENKPSFTVKEISNWFGLCGFKKPAVMPVALSDTKRKYGYIDSKGRDQWIISTSGENLILERQGG